MSRDENTLNAYRDGSAQVRLDIYLAHPGLRGRFDEIEGEEERPSAWETAAKRRAPLPGWLRPLVSGWWAGHS